MVVLQKSWPLCNLLRRFPENSFPRESKWPPRSALISRFPERGSSRPLFGKMENDHRLTSSSLVWVARMSWHPADVRDLNAPIKAHGCHMIVSRVVIFFAEMLPMGLACPNWELQGKGALFCLCTFRVTADTFVGHSGTLNEVLLSCRWL